MIHRTAIIDRLKGLIRTKGAQSVLGLKTLQQGRLRNVPQPEYLDEWLPAVLINIPRTIYQDPFAECAIRVVVNPIHSVNIYYVRRYPDNEIATKEDERGLKWLAEIFEQLTAQDRLTILDNTLLVGMLMKEIDYEPPEEYELGDMLSDLSASAIRAELELVTLG